MSQFRELARRPNIVCKMSGLATEAKADWKPDDLRPFMDAAFEAFGFERMMFGGDWPVTLQAIQPSRWIALLHESLGGVNETDQRKFWRDNAIRVYRLAVLSSNALTRDHHHGSLRPSPRRPHAANSSRESMSGTRRTR